MDQLFERLDRVGELVIGRPILGAANPVDAAKKILDEIRGAERV